MMVIDHDALLAYFTMLGSRRLDYLTVRAYLFSLEVPKHVQHIQGFRLYHETWI